MQHQADSLPHNYRINISELPYILELNYCYSFNDENPYWIITDTGRATTTEVIVEGSGKATRT